MKQRGILTLNGEEYAVVPLDDYHELLKKAGVTEQTSTESEEHSLFDGLNVDISDRSS